jgi:hypothetical protein
LTIAEPAGLVTKAAGGSNWTPPVLADRHRGDHLVGQRVDRRHRIGVLQPDIDTRAIARWPNAVRQLAG